MKEQVRKLIRGIEFGFMAQVVTGTVKNLTCFRNELIETLIAKSYSVEQVDLYSDAPDIKGAKGDKPILLVWGLEQLAPAQSATYAIRSHLDVEKHAGLRSVIFCEDASYSRHFNDYDAPFYKFCTRQIVD